jgi:ketosteroid isomerase-like protein
MMEFLIAAIEERDFEFVKKMMTEDYVIVLRRDPVLEGIWPIAQATKCDAADDAKPAWWR